MTESEEQRGKGGYGSFPDCRQKLAGSNLGWLSRSLSCLAAHLDYRFRTWDFRHHRSYDGPLSRIPWIGGRLDGHAPNLLLLPALLALFVIFGPKPFVLGGGTPIEYVQGLAGWLAALLVLLAGMTLFGERGKLWFQLVWITALCGVVWWQAGGEAIEAEAAIYRHLMLGLIPAALVPVVAGAAALAWLLVRRIPADYRAAFRDQLPRTELFQAPPYPRISAWAALGSVLTVLLYRLVALLWLPSLFLVAVIPPGGSVWLWTLVVAGVWLLLIALMVLHPRLDAINAILRRAFFTGGQLLVSLVIIVLGIGRLLENPYIAPVIESSFGPAFAMIILAAYTFFWFFEYWLNRILCESLLGILRADGDRVGKIKYPFAGEAAGDDPEAPEIRVPATGRVLQIHGGARFVAVWHNPSAEPHDDFFQLYEKRALFERLTPRSGVNRIGDLINRIRFYFSTANLALLGAVLLVGWLAFGGRQLAEQVVNEPQGSALVDLRELLFEGQEEDVLLLAASGGGTRAALYATGVLRGLSELGQLGKLRLISGVSGGGAALAYFAGRRAELSANRDHEGWTDLRCTMDDPFIWDVLDGVAEWRIFGETRLGTLLAESFARRFSGATEKFKDKSFESIPPDLGLILNTSLAGHLKIPEQGRAAEACAKADEFAACARQWEDWTLGSDSGGRLIFTNLAAGEDAFPGLGELHPPAQRINYTVIADPTVPLTTAAALQANFPPVFTNAAVDVPVGRGSRPEVDGVRYWVTDGGAVENRGVLSLLFALRAAVDAERDHRGDKTGKARRFHLLVAEASGESTGYSSFPGVSSKFGAPAKLGSQLMKELQQEIQTALAELGGTLDLYYLDMPGALRVDGGLGTHWMLAGEVRLSAPHLCDPERREQTLSARDPEAGTAVRNAIYELFVAPPRRDPGFACAGDDPVEAAAVESILTAVTGAADPDPTASCWPENWRCDWERLKQRLKLPAALESACPSSTEP